MARWFNRLGLRLACGLSALLALAASADATETARPKIALVLSGGGAAGIAHVGVIKELERLGVRPDLITGTSMGAVVGGLYASGFTPDDLERAVTEVDWTRILDDASERELIQPQRRDSRLDPLSVTTELPIGIGQSGPTVSAGLVDGVKLTLILRSLTVHVDDINDFDDLPIPFRAVATDLVTAQPVVLGDGDLGDAMRASMSIPGFFPAVQRNGQVLVDGGVTNNLPIDIAKDLGADIVIASFIPPAQANAEDLDTLTGTLSQSIAIFIHARSRAQISTLSPLDVLLTPGVEDVGMLEFDRAPDTIGAGVAAVQRQSAALSTLLAGRDAPPAWESVGEPEARPLSYDQLVIEYEGRLDPEILRRRLGLPEAGTVTPAQIEIAARQLYGLELFDSVTYRFEERDAQQALVVRAKPQNQGLLRPRLGVALSNVFGGDGDFTFAAGATLPELNSRGGRADIDVAVGQFDGVIVRLEQPIDTGLQFFIGNETGFFRRSATLFGDVDDRVSEIGIQTFATRMSLEWSPDDQLRFGTFIGFDSTKLSVDVGSVPGETSDSTREDRAFVGARLDFDTLDDVDLPTRGIQIGGEVAFDAFDSDSVGEVTLDALAAYSFGTHTLSPYFFVEGDLDRDSFGANLIGGFPQLPGFEDGELVGDVVGVAGARYYRRFEFIPFFGSDAFVGGSLAYGGAFEDWTGAIEADDAFFAGSIFTGIETRFGPAILSFGAAEQGQYLGAFTLGTRF